MDKGESIGSLYVEIKAQNEITKELNKIQRDAVKGADQIEDQFRSLRLSIRTDLMKKSMSTIRDDHGKLKKELEKLIKLDANYEDLEKVQTELEESERALKKFTRETHKAEKEIDEGFISKAKSKFGSLGTFITSMFAGLAIGAFFKSSVEAFFESEKAAASLEQQLGYTSDALNEYAAAVQNTTVYEDDLVIGAMTRIAAFTKDEEQIKALTAASLDLAAAKGMDLTSAADMVAKSFGSETNALARSGIEVEGVAGSTERLIMVTEGISKLYGGQAAAQANTYGGKLEILKNKFGDLKEEIGSKLAPAIGALSTYFGKSTDQMKNAGKSGNSLKDTFNAIAIVGVSLFTSLKIVWIGLTTLIGGVIGFANLGITAISTPFKMFINLMKSVSDLGPSVMAIIKGDWANVNYGAIATAAKNAVIEPVKDLTLAFDRMIVIGKRGWGQIKDEVELAKSFGSQLKYQDFLSDRENNNDGLSGSSTLEGEVADSKEKNDQKLQSEEEYYNELKWESKNYASWRAEQDAKELKDMEAQLGAKFEKELWLSNQKKRLDEDYEVWQAAQNQKEQALVDKKFKSWYEKAKYWKDKWIGSDTVGDEALKGINPSDVTYQWDKNRNPRGLNKDGTLTAIKEGKKITGTEYFDDFNALKAVDKFTEGTIQGQLAWDALGDAVSGTLQLIRIRLADDASEMEQIWAGMINGMMAKLSDLLAQWFLLNTLAAFLPGAGFGSIGFKTLLGIPEAATGGTFLGTNNGVMKMAMGGDFIVPQGFANDSYPMLVQSGERVKVTPSGKVGDEAQLLAKLIDAVEANTLDRRMLGSRPIIVQPKISIGNRDLTKEVSKTNKTITREGWKQE